MFTSKIGRAFFLSSHHSAVTRYTPSVQKWEILFFYSIPYRSV